MKKNLTVACISIICCLLFISGCLELSNPFNDDNSITFQSHPTAIRYTLTYGYQANSSGTGKATLLYQEDLPEVAKGSILNLSIHQEDLAQTQTIAQNTMIHWNITLIDAQSITLSISTEPSAESLLLADLNATEALSINNIQRTYPSLIQKYCQAQGNDTHWLIQPDHPAIQSISQQILSEMTTNNSLEIAKTLFHWLKTNTMYQIHPENESVQSATLTLQKQTGDCDDLSFLYLSLLRSVDIPARFIKGYLISEINGSMQAISHLWVEVFVGGFLGLNGWIPVECAGTGDSGYEIYQNFGVEDASHLRLFLDEGSNNSIIQSSRHISVEYPEQMSVILSSFARVSEYQILQTEKLCIKDNIRSYC